MIKQKPIYHFKVVAVLRSEAEYKRLKLSNPKQNERIKMYNLQLNNSQILT